VFSEHTPFIFTTAGSVERDRFNEINVLFPWWWEALKFATNYFMSDERIVYCGAWILARKTVGHHAFYEEVRELRVYSDFFFINWKAKSPQRSKYQRPKFKREKSGSLAMSRQRLRAEVSQLLLKRSQTADSSIHQPSNVRALLL
jgi:hypothetical protein